MNIFDNIKSLFGFNSLDDFKNKTDKEYSRVLKNVLLNGSTSKSRSGDIIYTFGETLKFNVYDEFPILTKKRVPFKTIVKELLFFMSGQTNTKILEEQGVKIWKGNTSKDFLSKRNLDYDEGDMGPMYGYQLRNFGKIYNMNNENFIKEKIENTFYGKVKEKILLNIFPKCDQYFNCLSMIKDELLYSEKNRRIMMTTFNPNAVKESVLWPCHGIVIQFDVAIRNDFYYLDCIMYQRSADMFLGLPFNITSYALLMYITCHLINSKDISPGILTINIGNCHIYKDHLPCVDKYLKNESHPPPKMIICSSESNLNCDNFTTLLKDVDKL